MENTNVDVFLLTDKKKEGNYSIENENEIIRIFKEAGYHIGFIKYVEDYDCGNDEDLVHDHFMNNVKHKKGIDNDFVPRLIYRKYFLNQLKNRHAAEKNIQRTACRKYRARALCHAVHQWRPFARYSAQKSRPAAARYGPCISACHWYQG